MSNRHDQYAKKWRKMDKVRPGPAFPKMDKVLSGPAFPQPEPGSLRSSSASDIFRPIEMRISDFAPQLE